MELLDIKAYMPVVPWLVVGDFNVIKIVEESSDYFQGCLAKVAQWSFIDAFMKLLDLPPSGPLFTWTNKRIVGLIARKLDRMIVNTC